MKKQLTLSKEQARTLYNLLSAHNVPDRSDNRKRFKFLEVIEDFVDEFDDQVRGFVGKPADEVREEITAIGKETKKFIFPDREVFAKAKDMFEKCYKTGTKSRNQMGKTESSPLAGRDAKVYMELEDCFADVVDLKEPDSKKK